MSIASGRAWQAAGAGLGNIGRLLVEQQEREREQRRQEEADRIAAGEREYSRGRNAMADARAAEERMLRLAALGVSDVPASAPAVQFNQPQFGASFPQAGARAPDTATSLGVAIPAPGPGYLSGRGAAPAPSAEAPLANIGRIAAATPTPRMRGLADTFQPGGLIQAAPSAANRAEFATAGEAARRGEVYGAISPTTVGALPPSGQTVVGADPAMYSAIAGAERGAVTADALARDAAESVRRHPELAVFSPPEQVRRGRILDTPRAPTGPAPRTPTQLQEELDRSRDQLFTVQRGAPVRPDVTSAAEEEKFVRDSALTAQQVGRLRERVARDSTAAAGGRPMAPAPVAPLRPAAPTAAPAGSAFNLLRQPAAVGGAGAGSKIAVNQREYDGIVAEMGAGYADRHYRVQP